MAKKLELKFLTSANTELIVSIADPKDGLALSAVQAEAAKIMAPASSKGRKKGMAASIRHAHGPTHAQAITSQQKRACRSDQVRFKQKQPLALIHKALVAIT